MQVFFSSRDWVWGVGLTIAESSFLPQVYSKTYFKHEKNTNGMRSDVFFLHSGIGFGVGLVLAIVFYFAAIPQLIQMKGDFALTCGLFNRHCLKSREQAEEEEDLSRVLHDPVKVYKERAQAGGRTQIEVIDQVRGKSHFPPKIVTSHNFQFIKKKLK